MSCNYYIYMLTTYMPDHLDAKRNLMSDLKLSLIIAALKAPR